ncbi:thioesterase (plasmid) [Photobacterium sp. GJ3]|uniref:thioesterase II family protein n=1 Tax=Photobacterium sp. GJ3 TaxID=2829502 RepID=UPI001B8CC541|nr:alpha/beta fold hydrolase [Photobacterium sp. GJ3]QUJ69269.1 thioesterase [Photobacterium sp. GJ3]
MMSANRRFICYQPNPAAELNLLCFPFAGGSATVFHPWAARLPAHVQMFAYQPPGRAQRLREPRCINMSAYIEDIWQGLCEIPDKPMILFGHSMGAFVAYELIRKLQQSGRRLPVKAVFSAAKSPWKNHRTRFLSQLADDDFISALKLKGGFPAEILNHHELMAMCTPFVKSDYHIAESYQCPDGQQQPMPVPAIVFGGPMMTSHKMNCPTGSLCFQHRQSCILFPVDISSSTTKAYGMI